MKAVADVLNEHGTCSSVAIIENNVAKDQD